MMWRRQRCALNRNVRKHTHKFVLVKLVRRITYHMGRLVLIDWVLLQVVEVGMAPASS